MPKNTDNEIFLDLLKPEKILLCNILIIKYLTLWLALGVMLR
jgi:hypothetical protein